MLKNCAKSCGSCTPASATAIARPSPEPVTEDMNVLQNLVKEYGEDQVVEGEEAPATLLVLRQTVTYMKNFVLRENPTHTMTRDTIDKCRNR